MKKIIFVLFLLSPFFLIAQKRQGYFQIAADLYNYSGGDPMAGGSIEIGTKGAIMGVGAGVGLTQFKGASGPYVPLFADISFYTNVRKARPILQLKGGFGVLDNTQNYIKQSGGAFLNPSIGLLAPIKKRDIIFLLGYLHSEITTKVNTGYTQASSSTTISGWSISIGVKL